MLFPQQFNFVGRILGPRGMTAKQLEQETGCKIMVRGKGSMRDKKKVIIILPAHIFGYSGLKSNQLQLSAKPAKGTFRLQHAIYFLETYSRMFNREIPHTSK